MTEVPSATSGLNVMQKSLLRPISILRKQLKHDWIGQDWVRAERFREKVEAETQKSLPDLFRYVLVCAFQETGKVSIVTVRRFKTYLTDLDFLRRAYARMTRRGAARLPYSEPIAYLPELRIVGTADQPRTCEKSLKPSLCR